MVDLRLEVWTERHVKSGSVYTKTSRDVFGVPGMSDNILCFFPMFYVFFEEKKEKLNVNKRGAQRKDTDEVVDTGGHADTLEFVSRLIFNLYNIYSMKITSFNTTSFMTHLLSNPSPCCCVCG